MKMKVLFAQSCLTLCDHVSTALQAPLSIEFSRLEYWSGLPFPTPEDLLGSPIHYPPNEPLGYFQFF